MYHSRGIDVGLGLLVLDPRSILCGVCVGLGIGNGIAQ